MEEWRDIKDYEGLYQVSNLGRIKSFKYGKEQILQLWKSKNNYLCVKLCKNNKRKNYYIHRLVAQAFLDDYSKELDVDHIDTNKENNNIQNLRMCTRKENNNNPLTRKHNSESRKGKYCGENNPMYGRTEKNSPFYGRHHSEETKRKLREAKRGENHPMWGKKGADNPNYGRHHTKETIKKMSENHADFNGENNPNAKAIICIETGKIYSTIKQCAKEMNLLASSITSVCKKKLKTTGGYHFKYVEEENKNNVNNCKSKDN